ncbi:MAG: GTPase HflX [Lachnospira sp.]|nr:GTPase HflX [Lachnospira sp.]
MAQGYDTAEMSERVLLVGVQLNNNDDVESSLEELKELAATAGAVTVGKLIQAREQYHPATYIGKGKLEEVKELIVKLDATGIICDDELSPAQLKNLEDALDTKVMDRTMVILDIFAARATTSEGKIQVEMAQLKYRSTRLAGLGTTLSRLGGGIGTRGPGEKKIETDRRIIRDRISRLSKELEEIKSHRDVARQNRSKTSVPVAAIVGYTNAGKSTLLNTLTNAGILSEDKLFATLDPTTRSLTLPNGEKVLVTDTVGFIRKLPHHLIEAFKSTLEEAKYADIIIHVADSSSPDRDVKMEVVYNTLKELGVGDKPIVTLFNKCDRVENEETVLRDFKADYTAKISALYGTGIEDFEEILEQIIRESRIYVERTFGYEEAGKIQLIRQYGQLVKEEYTENGIEVEAYVPKEIYHKL